MNAHLSPAATVLFVSSGVKAYSLTIFLSGVGEKIVEKKRQGEKKGFVSSSP